MDGCDAVAEAPLLRAGLACRRHPILGSLDEEYWDSVEDPCGGANLDSREVDAGAGTIFELLADPAWQPHWDGNDNVATAAGGQRVRGVGEVFTVTLTHDGAVRENHVVEFAEGRRIAGRPAVPGQEPPGHLWRWDLEPLDVSRTRVTHTYDWTQLRDEKRVPRARSTTAGKPRASVDRLATLAEGE